MVVPDIRRINKMNKPMIASTILVLLTTGMVGCRKDGGSQTQASIPGKYYNEDNINEYIDIKADGTAFVSSSWGNQALQWKVYDNDLMLIRSDGSTMKGRIADSTILADDKSWSKRMKIGPKEDVVGTYIWEVQRATFRDLDLNGNGTYSGQRCDGGKYSDVAGTWKIVKVEGEEDVEFTPKLPLSFRLTTKWGYCLVSTDAQDQSLLVWKHR
jgi:hypothetical protein